LGKLAASQLTTSLALDHNTTASCFCCGRSEVLAGTQL
jgi:hypothetical protein